MPVSPIIGTRDRTGPGRNLMRPGVGYELGRHDRLGRMAAASIPGAVPFERPGLGHMPHVGNFEAFGKVVDQAIGGR